MALSKPLNLPFFMMFLCFKVSAQWTKTIHQAIVLPDTLSRFSIKSNFPPDTVYWIGADIIIETTISIDGSKKSVFDYMVNSIRYQWELILEKDYVLKPIQFPLPKLEGIIEKVWLKIFVPEYFKTEHAHFITLAGTKH
jgi:hypothetical protein